MTTAAEPDDDEQEPGPTAAPPRAQVALKSLIESHRGALNTMRTLCDGQLALLKKHEVAARTQGEELVRATYLEQMDLICQQQRLLAMQLSDAVRDEMLAQTPTATGDFNVAESLVI